MVNRTSRYWLFSVLFPILLHFPRKVYWSTAYSSNCMKQQQKVKHPVQPLKIAYRNFCWLKLIQAEMSTEETKFTQHEQIWGTSDQILTDQKQRMSISSCTLFFCWSVLPFHVFLQNITRLPSLFCLKKPNGYSSSWTSPHADITKSLLKRNSQKQKVTEVAEGYSRSLVLQTKKGGDQEMPWPEEGHLQHSAHRAGSSPWWQPR